MKEKKLARRCLPDYILQPITISYIFDFSILVHHWEIEHDHQVKIYLVSFRSTGLYSNLAHRIYIILIWGFRPLPPMRTMLLARKILII